MLMEELQQQMDRPGQATGFVVQVTPAGDPRVIERVRRDIEALDPAIAATPCAEFVRSLKQMQVARAMSWVAAAIAALIGAIGVLNTMAMSVLKRAAGDRGLPRDGLAEDDKWCNSSLSKHSCWPRRVRCWEPPWGYRFSAGSRTSGPRPDWSRETGPSRPSSKARCWHS